MPPSYTPDRYGLLWNLKGLASELERRGETGDAATVRKTIQAIDDVAKLVEECDTRLHNQSVTIERALARIFELEGMLEDLGVDPNANAQQSPPDS